MKLNYRLNPSAALSLVALLFGFVLTSQAQGSFPFAFKIVYYLLTFRKTSNLLPHNICDLRVHHFLFYSLVVVIHPKSLLLFHHILGNIQSCLL
jgi:hypothetical protein